jgi:hypothetical protein
MVYRIDISVALSTGRRPLFSPSCLPWACPIDRSEADLIVTPEAEWLMANVDWRLDSVWADLREYCRLTNLAFETGNLIPIEIYQDTMNSVFYRLADLNFTGCVAHPGVGQDKGRECYPFALNEALRLGMLAFAVTIYLRVPGLKKRYEHLAEHLKIALLAFDTPWPEGKDQSYVQQLYLWLLFAGYSAIFNHSDDYWLVPRLRTAIHAAGLKSWAGTRDALRNWLWINPLHDPLLQGMYNYTIRRGRVERELSGTE